MVSFTNKHFLMIFFFVLKQLRKSNCIQIFQTILFSSLRNFFITNQRFILLKLSLRIRLFYLHFSLKESCLKLKKKCTYKYIVTKLKLLDRFLMFIACVNHTFLGLATKKLLNNKIL